MAVKTFTTGEVLTAADTNTYLNNGGLVYIASGSPAANATINIDNVFTSTYRNYRIVMRMVGSGSNACYWRWRAGGATLADTIYSTSLSNTYTAQTPSGTGRADNYGLFGAVYATYPTQVSIDVYNPQTTDYSIYAGQIILGLGGTDSGVALIQGANKVTTSIDGFQLTTAAAPTITLNYTIYGYRSA